MEYCPWAGDIDSIHDLRRVLVTDRDFAADASEAGDRALSTVGTTEAVMAVLAVHKK
jgi:hypothetical protein